MSERKLFQKHDFILMAAVLALALTSFAAYAVFNRDAGEIVCRISFEGKTVRTIGLSNDGTFSLEEKPQIRFEIKDGSIAFIESDCPDKVCVNSGFLSKAGQMAACLPNGVSIFIVSDGGNGSVDMMAN